MPSCSLATGGLTTRMWLPPGRRAVVVDQLDRCLEDALGELARVGDRGAGADEDRVGAVVGADPPQAPDDVRDVAAEEPAVGVQLVDDDELQVLEELEPLRVVREDRRVEHVRVGDDDLAGRADDAAHVGRRVAVVGVRLEADLGGVGQRAQLDELVRRERLGGEEVEGPRRGVLRDGVEDRQVVAERLARCRRRDDDDVAPARCGLVGGRLVGVQRLDPAPAQRVDDPRVHALRPWRVARRARLELAMGDDERRERGARRGARRSPRRRCSGGAVSIGSPLHSNRTSVRSRTIAQVFESSACRCDSSPVASVTTWARLAPR